MSAHRGYASGAHRSVRGWKPILATDAEDTRWAHTRTNHAMSALVRSYKLT